MQGGPVLPALSELHRHPDPAQPSFRPLYSGPSLSLQAPPGTNGSPPQILKRAASQTPLQDESPAKKQSKWTPEEDNLTIELRGQGMKWDDIAKRLPGRSSISCRLRYQNYLEKRAVWDEEKKNKLARLYARFKDQMWQKVATEMGIPWRSAESMHWQLGEQEMSARANAPVFQLHPSVTAISSPTSAHVAPAPITHGFTPANIAQLVPTHPSHIPIQHQQQSHAPPPPVGPTHSYHQRTESGASTTSGGSGGSQGRRRNSSISRRRADANSRSSVPPQLGPNLPRIQPTSEADLVSGPKTTSALDSFGTTRPEGEDTFQNRRREDEAVALRLVAERRSPGGASPDQPSHRSGTGSVRSLKREELDERIGSPREPPAVTV